MSSKSVSTNQKAISGKTLKIIVDVIILIIGIILIAAPNQSLSVITMILGIVLIGYGVISVIINASKGTKDGIAISIVCAVLGAVLLIFNSAFANTVLPFVIGAWMLIMGIVNVSISHKLGLSLVNMVLSIVAIVVGIIILIGVFVGHNTLGVLLGVCMLVYGIAQVINLIAIGAKMKKTLG